MHNRVSVPWHGSPEGERQLSWQACCSSRISGVLCVFEGRARVTLSTDIPNRHGCGEFIVRAASGRI